MTQRLGMFLAPQFISGDAAASALTREERAGLINLRNKLLRKSIEWPGIR